jgi:glycosyltransferase involved in cell wall biosynthesis
MSPPEALFFGSYDVRLHPRVAVLRDGLAEHGWTVRELNAPLGSSTADKVDAAGSPAAAVRLVWRMFSSWSRLVAGRRRAGRPDVVVVGYLGHLDVHLARLLFPGSVIVLDHLVGLADTIRDRGLGGNAKLRVLEAVDRWALRAADVVVVDTPAQAAELPELHGREVAVVPVGATREWADARLAVARRGSSQVSTDADPLRVVFFGLYTPLQGAPTIGASIAALADDPIDFTMVGTGQDRGRTMTEADGGRVRWLDWVDADDLPAEVAGHDVCLGIFSDGPKARRVVATKVYQGLAAGCAIVTADTPAARQLLDGDVEFVAPADPEALTAALRALATDHDRLEDLRRRSVAAARRFTPAPATTGLHELLVPNVRARSWPLPPLTLNAWLRWDVIGRELDRIDASSVLEIGPGEGAVACRLALGRSYTGVELSPRTRAITAERLQARGTPGRVVASLDELGPGEQFDLLCAFEVLEHIEDDVGALRSWFDRIRPGGRILLSTPADPQRMGPHDVVAGHLRRYSMTGMTDRLLAAGFTDVATRHVGFPVGFALEGVRNAVARRRLHGLEVAASSPEVLTELSSSIMQPPAWAGAATRLLSSPARLAQRAVPSRGTGLVAVARVPG